MARPKKHETFIYRVYKQVRPTANGCYEFFGCKSDDGYGRINKNGKLVYIHREIYKEFNGDFPKELSVCHTCDNPSCVNPDHLETGTQSDNMKDAAKKGRTARGDNTGPRKHPERMPRGDSHWSKRFPEKWKAMNKARIESCLKSWEKYRQSKEALRNGEPSVKEGFNMRITKISTEDALNIRAYFYGGAWNQNELADRFGVNQSVISRIVTGSRSWSFLDN